MESGGGNDPCRDTQKSVAEKSPIVTRESPIMTQKSPVDTQKKLANHVEEEKMPPKCCACTRCFTCLCVCVCVGERERERERGEERERERERKKNIPLGGCAAS